MIIVTNEPPDAGPTINDLLDQTFGVNRHQKSSYFYRQGVAPVHALCMTALDDGKVVGTIRAWPIGIGAKGAAILLGPVAVDEAYRGIGLAARLIKLCLGRARISGWTAAVLVGDKDYYGRFGFVEAEEFGIAMERENPARVLAFPLRGLESMPSGVICPWRHLRLSAAA